MSAVAKTACEVQVSAADSQTVPTVVFFIAQTNYIKDLTPYRQMMFIKLMY